jgi:hypothetical protein
VAIIVSALIIGFIIFKLVKKSKKKKEDNLKSNVVEQEQKAENI